MKPWLSQAGIMGLTALLLVGILVWGGAAPFQSGPEVESYFADVAAAVDKIPYQSGVWLGADIPVTPAATDLLKPNKLIQRRYQNAETGEWFELLVVHCGDVRDMIGHYPPVCYPAHGWKLDSRATTKIEIDNAATDAALYSLSRNENLSRDAIDIVNFFVLPSTKGPAIGSELAFIQEAGRYYQRARLGAAQVQVITLESMPEARREEAVKIALALASGVLHEVERGLE